MTIKDIFCTPIPFPKVGYEIAYWFCVVVMVVHTGGLLLGYSSDFIGGMMREQKDFQEALSVMLSLTPLMVGIFIYSLKLSHTIHAPVNFEPRRFRSLLPGILLGIFLLVLGIVTVIALIPQVTQWVISYAPPAPCGCD